MESSGEPSLPSAPDWDRPITQAELDAIEAAFTHAATSSSTKRRRSSSPGAVEVHSDGRRLPSSLGRCQKIPSLDRSEVENCSSTGGDSFVPRIGQWNPVYSPYQAKARYPTMNFGGRIAYSRTLLEVEKATMELLEIIETKKKNVDQVPLGFDIEWRPIFRRGYAQRKAAVIQICGDSSNCYVMHIIHSGIPPILRTLLEDLTSLKVGICIANDANKIFNDYNVRVKPVEDLSSLANSKVGGSRKWSLSSLTEMLTCKQLEKPDKIRLGDWEANILSREQLQYAATDAFVSWYLYQVLQNFPDASESKSG
ncbi:Werner Syndrome-like exonuclease isoform X1 [Macadamia integrifolia]|uniref:Werner Syndrome-like exonuclease isoform X1 n=1 Tax=Macadamia integrifolia TaxID=60698 RepID=UPI001C4F11E9|nr:Werner Syndrome-like exonuclease isoform X1 [Macadamia integrifolia]